MSDTSPEVPPNPLVPDETPELATMRAQLEAIERQRAQLFNLCVALVAIAGGEATLPLPLLATVPPTARLDQEVHEQQGLISIHASVINEVGVRQTLTIEVPTEEQLEQTRAGLVVPRGVASGNPRIAIVKS